jgi:hypothetical protein
MSISIFDGRAENLAAVFGPRIIPTAEYLRTLAPSVFSSRYRFEDPKKFERRIHDRTYSAAQIQQVYWREILFRAHMAAGVSLLRNARWMEGAAREYGASNFLAWTACLRGLIEAIGDSMYAFQRITLTLAHNHRAIRRCLEGKESKTEFIPHEIEDALIHLRMQEGLPGLKRTRLGATKPKLRLTTYRSSTGSIQKSGRYTHICVKPRIPPRCRSGICFP